MKNRSDSFLPFFATAPPLCIQCVLNSRFMAIRAHPMTHTQKANVRHLLIVEMNMMQNPANIGIG